ncbi:MAG: hypothetical protein JO130_13740 [Solirubrobacterales bacterium]|nr:hypothetical protein [Solirubrobacterales bacterium]
MSFPVTVAAGQSVLIKVDRVAGPNAVLSGIFLGEGSATSTPPPVPSSFFGVDNYSADQTAYAGDLQQLNTKWWEGGLTLMDKPNQTAMLAQGYHFLPTFNTGLVMREAGLTSVSASTTQAADPTSCVDEPCTLNTSAILGEVQSVQAELGGSGNYYSVGNEVDDSFSDDVSPNVYVGQFDAWVNAIKQGDPTAKIVAPSISSVSCCNNLTTQPWGTAGQWFASFVTDYEQQHNGTKPPIDVLAMHLYNEDLTTGAASVAQIANYVSEVQTFRQEANSLGYAGTPIWITEFGFLFPPGGPLTTTQSDEITGALTDLEANASSLDLQRMFAFTDDAQSTMSDGLRPLFNPNARSSPSTPMGLTDYGQLIAGLDGG